jgi:hypothetical protein
MRFLIVEGKSKFEVGASEAKFLAEFPVLVLKFPIVVLQFGGGMFQLSKLIDDLIDLLSMLAILQLFSELVKPVRYLACNFRKDYGCNRVH